MTAADTTADMSLDAEDEAVRLFNAFSQAPSDELAQARKERKRLKKAAKDALRAAEATAGPSSLAPPNGDASEHKKKRKSDIALDGESKKKKKRQES